MLTTDSDRFSLVIPTYQGTPFLRRCLEYLTRIGFLGHVVLADDSCGEHRSFVESCPAAYPELWLDLCSFDHGTQFLTKVRRTLEQLPADYVMLCGHDDFIVPEALENIAALLENDSELVAAHGRVARFMLRVTESSAQKRELTLETFYHPMHAYLEETATDRVLAHLRHYGATLYSLHRRTKLIEALRATEETTRNVIFFQYLSSCLTVGLGKVACTDDVYLARQVHSRSWAATLQDDYEHLPLLLTSPDYSRYYGEFRDRLLRTLGPEPAQQAEGLGRQIDTAFLDLLRKGFCRVIQPSAQEQAFFERLNAPGSEENRRLQSIAEFAANYPDTY
jgi:glycosyltransferase domain-containing protein